MINKEDYNDVKRNLGKSTAKKVSRVTNDSYTKKHYDDEQTDLLEKQTSAMDYHSKKQPLAMNTKKKSMAKKMLSGQDLEDHLENKMLGRLKTKSQGIRNSRKLLG